MIRVRQAIKDAFQKKKRVALFLNADVKKTQQIGRDNGLTDVEVSEQVSAALVLREEHTNLAFLTGGDTAISVMLQLGATTFHLFEELELGVPIGQIDKPSNVFMITKARNFGTE